jgi:hypothetical protein
VLPQLPPTEFEQSGKLNNARSRMRRREGFLGANMLVGNLIGGSRLEPPVMLPLAVPYLVLERRAFVDYRAWTLEQLALATAYLLGPDEPMLAGETTMFGSFWLGTVTRDRPVAVTGAPSLAPSRRSHGAGMTSEGGSDHPPDRHSRVRPTRRLPMGQ